MQSADSFLPSMLSPKFIRLKANLVWSTFTYAFCLHVQKIELYCLVIYECACDSSAWQTSFNYYPSYRWKLDIKGHENFNP